MSRRSCPHCRAQYRAGYLLCPRDGVALVEGADPLAGTLLDGRYQVEAKLGEGALGIVYRARHARMSRRFAVKVPFGDVAAEPGARERFAREAEAACRLSHPNVIGVVDSGETREGLLYLVMELAAGPSLADVGPLPIGRALRVVAGIARGLAHAHARGLVHRDLKPANVILEDGDRPRIVDFGIALAAGDQPRVTTVGCVVGTPHYMAPEQALGEAVDARADVWALGLIAYELIAGALPFDGGPMEIVYRYATEAIPPLAGVPAGVAWLVQTLLAREPGDRPDDLEAIADLCEQLAAAQPVRRERVAMRAIS